MNRAPKLSLAMLCCFFALLIVSNGHLTQNENRSKDKETIGHRPVHQSSDGPDSIYASRTRPTGREKTSLAQLAEKKSTNLKLIGGATSPDQDAQVDSDSPVARTDQPDEAVRWRVLRQIDENGSIPPNALMNARAQAQLMPVDSAAWPIDLTSAPSESIPNPEIAGIQPSGWSWLGPGNVGGRIRSILIHPTDPQTMWVGSVGGGVWKTTNGGNSWFVLNDFMANLAVNCMVLDPTNPNILYAGTGEGFPNLDSIRGAGVFKSIDGGTTWTQLSSTTSSNWYYVNRLAINPGNPQIILAATLSGVWRSTDGGTTWTLRLAASVTDIDFDPTDGNKCITTGVLTAYYSTNGGVNWTPVTGLPTSAAFPAGRIEVAYARSNPAIVYAGVDHNDGELYASSDGGHSFTLRNVISFYNAGNGGQGWYDNIVWVDPTNSNNLIVGGIFLWRSTNAGFNFANIGGTHADQHAIVQSPQFNGTSNKQVFFGSDGGMSRTDDVYAGNVSNFNLNNNLGITQFYGGAGNASTGRIVGGAQDNSTVVYTGSQSWGVTFCCYDGGNAAADQTDSNYFYGETQWLGLFRSSNGGQSAGFIDSGIVDAQPIHTNFVSPIVLDPNNPNTFLAGGLSLWRSTNVRAVTPAWTSIKPALGTDYRTYAISSVAVATGNSNIIWVAHNNGDVYFTTNGTAATPTWTRADLGSPFLPDRYCSRVVIDPTNSNRVYATFGGFTSGNVWRTDNNGASWTNVTGNLPNAPVYALAVWKQNANNLYVGTEIGIFASADGGQTWSPSNDGPTNCSVEELFWMNNTLVAATHGRGMFSINLAGGGGTTNYVGYLDGADCGAIWGWAADRNRLNTAINVTLYDGATPVTTVSANGSRSDVGTFLGDNGLHGFSIPTPANLKNGATHSLTVKFETSATQLANTRNLTCSNTSYVGYLDGANCNTIWGWAADRNRLNTAISVTLYDGSTPVTTVSANGSRSDVGTFLGDNGLHGFTIQTPSSLKDGNSHSLTVRFESSSSQLTNTKPLTCSNTNYVGYLDNADCNTIYGWAADRNRLNTAINVTLYDGSTPVTTVLANGSRSDVGTFLGDNGLHGFTIQTPASLKNGVAHTLTVRFESSATQLSNAKSLTCTNYVGYFDSATCTSIYGWAADRYRLNTPINVTLYDGSTPIMTVLANGSRSDVGTFLGDNGLHGFTIQTPTSLKNGAAHSLRVKFESSTSELNNNPRSITCP